jgi:hypothetical protein
MSTGIFNNVRIGNDDLSSRLLLSDGENPAAPRAGRAGRVKRALLVGGLAVGAMLSMPTEAHAGIFGVFAAIFSLISGPIGSSLKEINQITQETQKLYQQTVWPLAAINQARGVVSTSISGYRAGMTNIFYTPFRSATLQAPQQLETILHSRDSSQLAALQSSFHTNFGVVPVAKAAHPQDRTMMDMDDALGQENLKATIVADQGQDTVLQTADQIENEVALSTPGSAPFLTAQAQVANLRCQAFMQKMLAAELRQEAGRIAHDNVLMKRRTQSVGSIGNTIRTALTRQ